MKMKSLTIVSSALFFTSAAFAYDVIPRLGIHGRSIRHTEVIDRGVDFNGNIHLEIQMRKSAGAVQVEFVSLEDEGVELLTYWPCPDNPGELVETVEIFKKSNCVQKEINDSW